jgi:hypothetical protein
MKLRYYSDPGHAWLSVSRKVLEKYVDPKEISTYSYQRKDRVFLEEDCDATKFIVALRKAGVAYQFVETHTNRNSKIRNYNCFRA